MRTFCLAACILAACQGNYESKEVLLRDGMQLLDAGNPGGAIVRLKHALDKDQNYFEARLYLVKAYSAAGKYDAAEKELQKLVRLRPDSPDIRLETAKMHLRKNRPDEALQDLAGLGASGSAGGEAAELTAWAYAVQGRTGEAAALLIASVERDPARLQTKMVLARVYALRGEPGSAQGCIVEILNREPGNREALYLLAAVRAGQRDFAGAHEAFDRILKDRPGDQDALSRKGALFNEQGNHDAALSVGDLMVSRSPNSPAGHFVRGAAMYAKGQMKDAATAFQKSLSVQPGLAAYYCLALTLCSLHEYEQAAGQIRKALELSPSFVQGRVLLTLILLKQNRIDDAIREGRKAVEQDGGNAAARSSLGGAYLMKAMYAEGMAELNRAVELDPKLVDARIKKGLHLIREGRFSEGEADLTSAVNINPELMNTRLLLASYHQQRGAHDKALRLLQEGIAGKPADSALYNMMAESYLHRNNLNEAAARYRKAREANPEDTHAAFRLASIHAARGEREQALEELTALAERSPGNLRALTALAALHESAGNDELASKYYREARDTGAPEGYLEEGKYLLRRHGADRAMSHFSAAIRKYPSSEALYEMQGTVQLSAKRYRDAVKTFEELAKLNARTGLPRLLDAHLAAGQYGEALQRIEQELRRDPRRLDIQARRSEVYLRMGKGREAADNAREIIRANPGDAAGYLALAKVHRAAGEPDKGIDALAACTVRDPDIAVMLARLYQQKARYGAALAQCRKAEELKRNYLPALFEKGATLHAMGRSKDAAAEYRRVLRLNPNHAPALNNLACLLADEQHSLSEAMQLAVRAYLLKPGDGAVNDTLGYVLLKRGKVEEGFKILKNAAGLLPGNPSVQYHLALAYRERGDSAGAVDSLRKAMAIGDFPEAKNARTLMATLQDAARPR